MKFQTQVGIADETRFLWNYRIFQGISQNPWFHNLDCNIYMTCCTTDNFILFISILNSKLQQSKMLYILTSPLTHPTLIKTPFCESPSAIGWPRITVHLIYCAYLKQLYNIAKTQPWKLRYASHVTSIQIYCYVIVHVPCSRKRRFTLAGAHTYTYIEKYCTNMTNLEQQV